MITDMLHQPILVYRSIGRDKEAQPIYEQYPTCYRGRWEDTINNILMTDGDEITITSRVYLPPDTIVSVGDKMEFNGKVMFIKNIERNPNAYGQIEYLVAYL